MIAVVRMSQDAEGPRREKEQRRVQVQMPQVQRVWSGRKFQSGASKRGLAETRYVDTASVDLNALEIGSVSLPERKCKIQIGIDSCAAVIVSSRMADYFSML